MIVTTTDAILIALPLVYTQLIMLATRDLDDTDDGDGGEAVEVDE